MLLIESTGKGSALPYHRWKLVLVLSALRHFVAGLREAGEHYLTTLHRDNTGWTFHYDAG
ncbi:MAG: cryptochrome/photolyase family protein [Gemmatimonadota bacterium]